MSRRDVAILLSVVVLLLLAALTLPRLSLSARAPFEPGRIAREIELELAQPGAAPDPACDPLTAQLRLVYAGLACSPSRYPASQTTERVNHIVHRYRARPTSGWQIGELGLTRSYRNPNQASPGAAEQTLFVVVSNTLIVVGYTD